MKKRICAALLALALCLSLCGCSGAGAGWFREVLGISTDPATDSPDSSDGTAASAAPENMAPITEISQGLTAFGLAYQLSYGLHPYRCVSLNNRVIWRRAILSRTTA